MAFRMGNSPLTQARWKIPNLAIYRVVIGLGLFVATCVLPSCTSSPKDGTEKAGTDSAVDLIFRRVAEVNATPNVDREKLRYSWRRKSVVLRKSRGDLGEAIWDLIDSKSGRELGEVRLPHSTAPVALIEVKTVNEKVPEDLHDKWLLGVCYMPQDIRTDSSSIHKLKLTVDDREYGFSDHTLYFGVELVDLKRYKPHSLKFGIGNLPTRMDRIDKLQYRSVEPSFPVDRDGWVTISSK